MESVNISRRRRNGRVRPRRRGVKELYVRARDGKEKKNKVKIRRGIVYRLEKEKKIVGRCVMR